MSDVPALVPFQSAMLPNHNADIVSVRRVVDPDDEEDGFLELVGADDEPIPVFVKRLKVRTWQSVSGLQQSLDDAQVLMAVTGLAVDDVIRVEMRGAGATPETHRVTSVLPPQAGVLGVSACRVTTVQRSH